MKQRTLTRSYPFEGKGIHTGRFSHVCIKPADENTGIVFVRTDLGKRIPALAENVSSTARSTTLSCGGASVRTVEHVLSALTGLGVDNAVIEIDDKEMPILDGSAMAYAEAIAADGLKEQDAERVWIELPGEIVLKGSAGAYVRLIPAPELSYESTIDFNSRVLGVQTVNWSPEEDYASQVAPCRTFCFLHEIEHLLLLGLAKGGDVNNAVVVVEKPVTEKKIARLASKMNQPRLAVTPQGYLSNVALRFPDECGRHKLLDLIGDLRLMGGFLHARVEAYKPGHTLNTNLAKKARKSI